MATPKHRYNYGIFETGEWFETAKDIGAELGLAHTAIDRYLKAGNTWFGLHIVRFPRKKLCRICGRDIKVYNKIRGYLCTDCLNTKGRSWKAKAKPKSKERISKSRFAWNVKKMYGLTPNDYQAMFDRQRGVCAICGDVETAQFRGKPRRLSIDHNHQTGNVRGLLCSRCNVALGLLGEDAGRIQKCLDYLQKGG